MELSLRLFPVLAIALVAMILPVYGQINTPCTASTLAIFTPCMNFLTNSSVNGTLPSGDCCNSLKNLTSNSKDCLCLIVTGSVPFQIPINRTLAISLPSACNMPGVPLQCKASGTPIPAPGPTSLGPTLSPGASPTSPQASPVVPEPTPSATSPGSDITPGLTPPSPDVDSGTGVPTTTPGSRPVLTPPSAAMPTSTMSPSLLLFALGFLLLKYC
ncbi:hypothetical protein Dsin_029646 [Dipteronia sinensis]|uniref:Bifunctional inhibitor/plant lipid transfer protein/seed storage helical domain-containing protein n=1 Tax=Dipteronia sinensis TaxID=43782 RepID=A0AAD9ZTH4_9ROSI|nr:hypothetical protein Dsin_029646 [Dipteronia sinensis]